MRTDELDFQLPQDLIAQAPLPVRSDARMLHYVRATGTISHRGVRELPTVLRRGDLLVFNDTRVFPARFAVRKPTGGILEGLWISTALHRGFPELGERDGWVVLLKGLGPVRPELPLELIGDEPTTLRVLRKLDRGYLVAVDHRHGVSTDGLVLTAGRMPLPPYIHREKLHDDRDDADRERYQTVFSADQPLTTATSVAAPTAGLHFDPALLDALAEAGVGQTRVRLDVGIGTFAKVEVDDLDEHSMHTESWQIDDAAATAINAARAEDRRVIAVGTTACRTLESQPPGDLTAGHGETNLLIQPPYTPRHIDALLTNFHLPRSTLIALVDGLIGTDNRRRVYAEAIAERYRFFSYGDCMLIE